MSQYSIEALLREAEAGNAQAQFEIANARHAGKGVQQNNAEAVKWYQQAAAQGHAGAQYELGKC